MTAAQPSADGDRLARIRASLPVVTAGGYFNGGYTGPLCAAAHEAAAAVGEREFLAGRMSGDAKAEQLATHARARELAAGLLGAGPGQVALTHHTTDGMNIVAHGLSWRPGDNAVTTLVEHKGGILPLGVLRDRHGVEVRTVAWQPGDPLDELPRQLAAAVDGRTRLVVVSHVGWVDGGILDLGPVTEAARRHGALVAVDGAQSAGVLPIDVTELDADAYAISGQKWLCGPEGSGALYVRPRCLDRIAQTVVGWNSVDTWERDGRFVPNPDVTRFEVGTRSLAEVAGLAAAIRWHRDEAGAAWAAERTAALADQARAALAGRGAITVLTPPAHTGLLSLRTSLPPEEMVKRMAERGYTIRAIAGYACIRASIGYFHTEDEVAALTDALIDASA
ncbi:MAG TPA: aminotransferase class V-fold PLP-dependent enzyme [Streptosporangiaceae bacterium]